MTASKGPIRSVQVRLEERHEGRQLVPFSFDCVRILTLGSYFCRCVALVLYTSGIE